MADMMSDAEITSFLGRKIQQSLNDDDGDLSQVRVENFNYYVGKPYGNERDGYSSVITREAMETVEWALPSILRVFTSGDRIVSFDPVGPEDEGEADQQTDIANHYILKENNGFIALHHWFKDALMFPNGYIKLMVDERECSKVEEYEGVTVEQLEGIFQKLSQKGEIEVVGQDSKLVETDFGPIEVYDVKLRVTWTDKTPKICAVPPDELLVDNDHTDLDLDEADCLIHRTRKNYTTLIKEGFDKKKLDEIGLDDDHSFDEERVNRLFHEDEDPDAPDEDHPSMRQFWVHECYVWLDVDGDGVAEYRRIVMIGSTIFDNEECDYQPFVALASILLPHKHTGLSYVDVVKDIQEIKSTLWRQLLDNIYKLNTRRKYVGENFLSQEGGTLDVLLDVTSEFIPARDPMAIREEVVQPIVSDILPVIQGMSDLQNVRTGVSPQLSLDPSILQQSTMGAFRSALEQASQRIEMVVRIFAETGMRQLMRKMHQLLRTYIDVPKAIRIRGEWVHFNPALWDERGNVSVNVGLGFNNKDQKIALLFQLLQLQKEAMGVGLTDPSKIYNALEDIVEAAGLGNVQSFFNDPAVTPPPQPQPDPMLELAKMDLQIKQQELQVKAQTAQTESQRKQYELQMKQNELAMQMQRLQKELQNMERDGKLTEAKTLETLEKARELDIDNDATESGVIGALENFSGR